MPNSTNTHSLSVICVNLQGKSRVQQSSTHTPSPPLSPRAPHVVDGDTAGESAGGGGGGGIEDGAEAGLSEQQQMAMQQDERILTEQIERLQKEKYAVLLSLKLCFLLTRLSHIQ